MTNAQGSAIRAVVDVGSNSLLLLVSRLEHEVWVPILEASRVTGLGVGTKTTGQLGEAGMVKTLSALAEFKEMAQEAGADDIRCGATMAARIANNTGDFTLRATQQGTPVEIILGDDEAQMGFESVASDPLFKDLPRLSIVDPGGHSTELVTADHQGGAWQLKFRRSYPVGALGLREELVPSETADPRMIFDAIEHLDDAIGLCYRPFESGTVVSLGATATNLISIRDKMIEWDASKIHGQQLDYEEVSRAAQWLLSLTDSERSAIPGIEIGRERSLHLGALILERFMFALRAETCFVSTRGWRHAYLEQ